MSTQNLTPTSSMWNVDGSSWTTASNGLNIGRTNGGSVYRAYMAFNLSGFDSTKIVNSATLHLKRMDSYGNINWVITATSSVPNRTFAYNTYTDVISSNFASGNKEEKSVTISASLINKYKGGTMYVCFIGHPSYSYSYGELDNVNYTPTLTVDYTIATSTMTASGNTIGSAVTLSITRHSSSFTHTISYSAGNQSGTIATKTSLTSVTWTPSLELCRVNTTGTTVSCTLTLQTYSGNTLIGTSTLSLTLNIPSSVVPSIVSDAVALSAVSDNTTVNSWGVYLKGYSKVRAVWTTSKVSGAYGSTISSYRMTVAGTAYTGTTATSAVLTSAGSVTVALTVTDSRGRTATQNKTITVLQYNDPYIASYQCYRSNVGGTKTDGGAYLAICAAIAITSAGSNAGTITVAYKRAADSSYSNSFTISSGTTIDVRSLGMAESTTYNIRITPADSLKSGAAVYVTLPAKSEDIVVWKSSSGLGLGIGKRAEAVGTEIVGPVRLYDSQGNVIFDARTDGSASSSPLPYKSGGTGFNNGNLPMRGITAAPTDQYCGFFFRVTQSFTVYDGNTTNTLTIPNFTHGVFTASTDAVMIGVDSNQNLYWCYRNSGTWRGRKY